MKAFVITISQDPLLSLKPAHRAQCVKIHTALGTGCSYDKSYYLAMYTFSKVVLIPTKITSRKTHAL